MAEIFRTKTPARGWQLHALPAAILVVVLLAEFWTPGVRVTPSLMTIALVCLSLLLPPRVLAVWSVILFLPVLATLLFVPVNGATESAVVILLRSTAYVFVAVMACVLSAHRSVQERQFNSLLSLFDALTTPIVVSDADGEISFANRACCALLGRSPEEVRGLSFFTLFARPDHRGKAIEHYLGLLAGKPGTTSEISLALRDGGCDATMVARCAVFQMDGRRLLVSQLGGMPS